MKRITSLLLTAGMMSAMIFSTSLTADAATVRGDVNGDGNITMKDASMIIMAVIGNISLTEDQQVSADFDGDGSLSTKDVFLLQQFVSGRSDVVNKYAYNLDERIKFIDLINADREELGVEPLKYNDATLSMGQLRAQEVLDGYVDIRADGRAIKTLFTDYGIDCSSYYEYRQGSQSSAQKMYNFLKLHSEDDYNKYFMSPQFTIICVGTLEIPNQRATQVVVDLC